MKQSMGFICTCNSLVYILYYQFDGFAMSKLSALLDLVKLVVIL